MAVPYDHARDQGTGDGFHVRGPATEKRSTRRICIFHPVPYGTGIVQQIADFPLCSGQRHSPPLQAPLNSGLDSSLWLMCKDTSVT